MNKETGIVCFKCLKRSGMDCPSREENESTLCNPCFVVVLLENSLEQAQHLLNMLNSDELTLKQFNEFIDEVKDCGV